MYVITTCKNKKSADKTRKYFQQKGIPATIKKVTDSRYLIVTDPIFASQVKMVR